MKSAVVLLVVFSSAICATGAVAQDQPGAAPDQPEAVAPEKPTVGVIGTGTLAGVMGPTLALNGYTVIYGSRDPVRETVRSLVERTGANASAVTQHEAAAQADVILLAVPAEVVEEVAVNLKGLEGKVVIDVSGGEKRVAPDGYLELVSDSARAERIQSRRPGVRVVRINMPSVIVFLDSLLLATRPTVPIAGNDPRAREIVANIIHDLGVNPWDAGPLRFARVFDAFNVMTLIPLQQRRVESYELKLVPSAPLSCFIDVVELFGLGQPYDIDSLPNFPRREEAVSCEVWRRRVPVGDQG